MTFPRSLDFDKIAFQVYDRMATSMKGWIDGGLTTEEPFINRITENFTRIPRKCDVGNTERFTVRADWSILHRQGDRNKDKFGSDVAVTIYVDGIGLIKTVLFQTKVSDEYEIRLDRDQLVDALESPLTRERAFVLAVDKSRQGIRIAKCSSLLDEFEETADSRGFNASTWMTLGEWLLKWISCDVGEPSTKGDSNSIERLLDRFVVESSREEDQGRPWGRNSESSDKVELDRIVPARTWLSFYIAEPNSGWIK